MKKAQHKKEVTKCKCNNGDLHLNGEGLCCSKYCVESKYTEKKSIKITLNALEKIISEASECNKKPALKIGIKKDEEEMIMITCLVEVKKIGGKK